MPTMLIEGVGVRFRRLHVSKPRLAGPLDNPRRGQPHRVLADSAKSSRKANGEEKKFENFRLTGGHECAAAITPEKSASIPVGSAWPFLAWSAFLGTDPAALSGWRVNREESRRAVKRRFSRKPPIER